MKTPTYYDWCTAFHNPTPQNIQTYREKIWACDDYNNAVESLNQDHNQDLQTIREKREDTVALLREIRGLLTWNVLGYSERFKTKKSRKYLSYPTIDSLVERITEELKNNP